MPDTAIATRDPEPTALAQPERFTDADLDLLRRTVAAGVSDDEFLLFVAYCRRTGLDPFSRQIYAIPRWVGDEAGAFDLVFMDGEVAGVGFIHSVVKGMDHGVGSFRISLPRRMPGVSMAAAMRSNRAQSWASSAAVKWMVMWMVSSWFVTVFLLQ